MLFGANLTPKYWEYAFYFFLRIHTVLPHGKNTVSPYHLATPRPADLSRLRTFGCAIYALSTKKRVGKLTMENVTNGIFSGYRASMKTLIYMRALTLTASATLHMLLLMKHNRTLSPKTCPVNPIPNSTRWTRY
jgi:hypothetical protein